MKHIALVVMAVLTVLLAGCATPLGQQYGTAGAIGGAVIGGVAGGPRGAIIGGVTGAVVGGAVGDSQEYNGARPYYAPPPPPAYRPCYPVNVPVYDRYTGQFLGYRQVCR